MAWSGMKLYKHFRIVIVVEVELIIKLVMKIARVQQISKYFFQISYTLVQF